MDRYPVALGLFVWLSASPLGAAPSGMDPLRVSLTGCADEPMAALAFISAIQLELDLGQRPILSPSETPAAIAVRVGCDGMASIRIRSGDTEDERQVRIDDVAADARPRVLALVVAEMVRSSAENTAQTPKEQRKQPDTAASRPKKATDPATASGAEEPARKHTTQVRPDRATRAAPDAPNAREPDSGDASLASGASAPRAHALTPWICTWAHLSGGATNTLYGGGAGIDWQRSRVQVEAGFASAERDRGSITSGLAVARYRHSVHVAGSRSLALRAALSSAAGVTWATGDSEIPGVVVRRVLLPYADARAEFGLQLWLAERIAPELALYSGGALGLLATNAGQDVLSSGGWLLGASMGTPF